MTAAIASCPAHPDWPSRLIALDVSGFASARVAVRGRNDGQSDLVARSSAHRAQ
jgi:hypothetical protein